MTTVRRILAIDDDPAIREAFRKILCPSVDRRSLDSLEASLFGAPSAPINEAASGTAPPFRLDTASQGQEGVEAVRSMLKRGTPYSLVFIDMRMPPGWDGIETASHVNEIDHAVRIVICSAYSDYSWHEVVRRVHGSQVRLLHKPFSTKDVLDFAWSAQRAMAHGDR